MKRSRCAPACRLSIGLAVLAWSDTAAADAAPAEWRSRSYYAVNGAVSAALVAGNVLTRLGRREVQARGDAVWFPGDSGLRGTCSLEAADLSDSALWLSVALPPAMELGGGLGARFANSQVVYTQALFAASLLTSAAKVIFRRPRPFSYRKDADCAFELEDADSHLSFFSGHTSLSFSAAFAGSLLMSERVDSETGAVIWGVELMLAGATANLRARAGKHYYSDLLVGALVGAGIGLGVPALHGAAEPPRASDWLAALGGLVVGAAGSQLLAFEAEASEQGALSTLTLSTMFVGGAHGLAARGSW